MILPAGWKFCVEVHPAGWSFPAEKSWIAGWIRPEAGQSITDVRARLHHRVILGLSGLPHPAFVGQLPTQHASSGAGFSFLFSPQRDATLLCLEARDQLGQWREFFRTKIAVAPDATVSSLALGLNKSLRRLTILLLKLKQQAPRRSWRVLANNLMATFVAEPLNTHPNAPFLGALEEPHEIGRLRYGRISMSGWLAHPTARITRLTAVIDPLPVTILSHGLARADINGLFPALGHQPNTAFVGEITLPADLATPVLLKLFAELDTGGIYLVFAHRFTPHQHGDTGPMPPLLSGLTYTRAIWALHRSAGKHAVSRHGLIRAARAIWVDYKASPVYRPKKKFSLQNKNDLSHSDRLHQQEPACTLIAPADDMNVTDASQYFQIGQEALKLVQHAVTRSNGMPIEKILDLPCGYGRVARWFRTAYPTAKLTVCDTQGAGVAFCVEHLGAVGVQAAMDGSHWPALDETYDIIWCGSLLTHVDRDQWINQLRRFTERLTLHGVLVFTSHGLHALEQLQSGVKDYGLPPAKVARLKTATVTLGFGYVGYPDTPAYGISIAQPGWIHDLLDQYTQLQVLEYRVAAWDQHQDVIVCSRRVPGEKSWLRKIFPTSA